MRSAAARLLIEEGPAAVTHRRVAAAAGVAAGSATYYFPSRDELYAQAVEGAEDLRAEGAERFAAELSHRRRGPRRTAELLLETLYYPRVTADVVPLRLEPMLAASRQPGLATIMREHRPRLLAALRTVLAKCDPSAADTADTDLELIALTIDGALLHGGTESGVDPVPFATEMVARLVALITR